MNKIIFIALVSLIFTISSSSQWIQFGTSTTSTLRSVIFINNQIGYAAGFNSTIIKTTNGGLNWNIQLTGSSIHTLFSISFINLQTGFAAGVNGKLLRSTNGISWDSIPGVTPYTLYSIHFPSSNTGYICGSVGVLLKTTNSGANWQVIPTGLSNVFYSVFFTNENTGYMGEYGGIIKSTNGGINWVNSLISSEAKVNSIYFIDANIGFAACDSLANIGPNSGRIYRTIDGGQNWILQFRHSSPFNSVFFPSGILGYAVTVSGKIFRTTDSGLSWNQQSSGVTSFLSSVYFTDTNSGFIVGSGGIFLKTINGGITSSNILTAEIPDKFALLQNYPNPFNPTTHFGFRVADFGMVRLSVYDVLGKEVQLLINEELQPGTYQADWDASAFPSGVYYYKLESGVFKETKKMVLLK